MHPTTVLIWHAGPLNGMELHRLLTFLGVVLLVATFAIQYGGEENGMERDGFNFAYVTGIAMLAVFMASFVLFNKNRWDVSKG